MKLQLILGQPLIFRDHIPFSVTNKDYFKTIAIAEMLLTDLKEVIYITATHSVRLNAHGIIMRFLHYFLGQRYG